MAGRMLRCPYCGHPVTVRVHGVGDRDGPTIWAECGNCLADWHPDGSPDTGPQIKTIAQSASRMEPDSGDLPR